MRSTCAGVSITAGRGPAAKSSSVKTVKVSGVSGVGFLTRKNSLTVLTGPVARTGSLLAFGAGVKAGEGSGDRTRLAVISVVSPVPVPLSPVSELKP